MVWPSSTAFAAGQTVGVASNLQKLRDDVIQGNRFVIKTADESVTSNAVAQNDDQLALSIPGAGTYVLDAYIYALSAANAAGDIRIGATWPTATVHFGGTGPDPGLASGSVQTGEWKVSQSATSGSSVISFGTSTTAVMIWLRFIIIASNSGTFQLQWAQVVSNGSSTTVKAGSHLQMTQVA